MRKIGLGETLRIALMGNDERVSAQTAMRIGLVSEVVTPDDLWSRAHEIAATIAAKPPSATAEFWRQAFETRRRLSPPAPPPKEAVKRPRGKRGAEPRLKEQSYDDEDAEEGLEDDEDLDDLVGDEDDLDLGLSLPKVDLDAELPGLGESELIETDAIESAEDELEAEEPEPVAIPPKRESRKPAPPKPAKEAAPSTPVKVEEPASAAVAKAIAPKAEKVEKPKSPTKPAREAKPATVAGKTAAAQAVEEKVPAPAAEPEKKAAKVKPARTTGGAAPTEAPKADERPKPSKPSKRVGK